MRDGVRNQLREGNTCMGLQRKVSQYSKLETWRVAFLCEESAFYGNFGKSGALCIGEPSDSKIDTLWMRSCGVKFRSSRILIPRYKARTTATVKIPEFQFEGGTVLCIDHRRRCSGIFIGTLPGMFIRGATPEWFIRKLLGMVIRDAAPACFPLAWHR